ncbi:hypothetical protein JHW46_06125 [Vibrio splendidus]|nr:hypothetical protein [Vibrio splendidus]
MSDFTAIGQLVTEARNLLDSIKGGAIRTMQNSFDSAMSGFTRTFNSKLSGYQGQMNTVTKAVMEVINGVNVYHVAGKKMYTIKHTVANGGYKKGANIDPAYPNVADPTIPPTYFNLIEFAGHSTGSGDLFRVEFYQTHRGMNHGGYVEHFVFTGSTSHDSVSGYLEVKKTTARGGICLFVSEPKGDREIAITKEMEGQIIPISLRDIGQRYDNGVARLTLKVDTRHQAGATRQFCVNGEYTSSKGRPPVSLVNDKPVSWSK